jgi:hypothetical protein
VLVSPQTRKRVDDAQENEWMRRARSHQAEIEPCDSIPAGVVSSSLFLNFNILDLPEGLVEVEEEAFRNRSLEIIISINSQKNWCSCLFRL